MHTTFQTVSRQVFGIICVLLLLSVGAALAQQPAPPQQGPPPPAPSQPLSPDQLANLVAPIALYPDSLLSQILVAAGYPLEIVEAGQWLQQNRNLKGAQLVEAARQQNWDPSVQALVVFPDVVTRLNSNIRWTTDLGNAFLAQQADVMDAVQRLRAQASQAGKLKSNSQVAVTTQTEGGQAAIEIQPADPELVYVPVYNPAYFWGPSLYGPYPPLFYPQIGFGFGFGGGIYIGSFFGGLGWGGWGWGPSWFGHSIYMNNFFFHRYGFGDFHGAGFEGRSVWAHDPAHRLGVPYPNRALSNRFRNAAAERSGGQRYATPREQSLRGTTGGNLGNRSAAQGQRFGNPGFDRRSTGANHSAFGGIQGRSQTRQQSDHGYSSLGAGRTQSSRGGGMSGGGGMSRGSRGGGRH
jgi:hypothetical protein